MLSCSLCEFPLHEWGLLESVPSPLNTPQIQIIKDWKALLLFFSSLSCALHFWFCQAWSCTSCACDLSAGDLASACYCNCVYFLFTWQQCYPRMVLCFLVFLCTVQRWWALAGTQREEEVPCFRGALEGTRCIWKTTVGEKKAAENQLNFIFTQHRELVKKSFERGFHKIFMANNKTTLHVLKVCQAEMFIVLADVKNMNAISIYTSIYIYIIKQANFLNKIIVLNIIYFQKWNAIL